MFLLSPRLWSDRSRARHSGTSDRCKHRPGGLQLLAPSPGARLLEARDSPLQGLGGQWFQLRTEVHRLSRWAGWHRRLLPPRSAALATSPLSRSSMGSSGYAVNPGSSLLLCCSDSDLSPCDVASAVFPGAVLRSTFAGRVTPLVNFLAPSELWASSRFGPTRAFEDLELSEHSFLRSLSPSAHPDGVSLFPSPERDSDIGLPANLGATRRFSRLRRLAPPPPVVQVSPN